MTTRTARMGALAVAVAVMLAAQPVRAADLAFAKIIGASQGVIEGDSVAKVAPKSIQVLSTGFGLSVPVAIGGTGSSAGKAVPGPVTIVKRFDPASPKLLKAAFLGEPLTVDISWFMSDTGKKTVSILLEGAFITQIDGGAQLAGTEASAFESVSLNYSRITFSAPILDASGAVIGTNKVCFDVVLYKAC